MIEAAQRQPKDQKVAIGVDVGGTKILAGHVTDRGRILQSREYPMDRTSQQTAIHSLEQALEHYLHLSKEGLQPVGIGVGLVGHVDPGVGVWRQAMNIPIHKPVCLSSELEKKYALPVALDNDVRCATQAELLYGNGKGYDHFIYLNIGTGISMGIVSDGRLIRGAANYAGEIGHMSVNPQGAPCICGRSGCIEPVASGGGMLTRTLQLLNSYTDSSLHEYASRLQTERIFMEARQGDPLAARIVGEAVEALQIALTNIVNVLNPEAIILGGGVSRDTLMAKELEDGIRKRALPVSAGSMLRVEPSVLGVGSVGLLGAASLVWRRA